VSEVVEVKLEAPGKNALGTEHMQRVLAELRAAGGAPVLLTGAGDAFSAGLNLKEVASLDTPGMEAFLRLLGDLTRELFDYPGPTVALVNGHAIAGGCVLALCCDLRVGVPNPRAKIGLNEVALGLRFPPSILKILAHQLTPSGQNRVILGAGLHSPADALALGILDLLPADAEAAASEARASLAALAAHPAAAYAAAKADLRRGVSAADAEDERSFLDDVLPVWAGDELKQRIAAVLAR
jgi:Delta3-Delta2-enoyl-CoA isomerase